MNIDSQELQQLEAAGRPRLDLYAGIHKALRAAMAQTLLSVGRMDYDDAAQREAVLEGVEELLHFCRAHVAHENEFMHPAIEARQPGQSMAVAREHEHHVRRIAQLSNGVAAVRSAAASGRAAAAQWLYRELALFVADNFMHMHAEETELNAALWACYSDAELEQLHDRLVSSIAPQELMAELRWLVPFMNPGERLGMLSDMRAKAGEAAVRAVLDSVKPHLMPYEWSQLARELGM